MALGSGLLHLLHLDCIPRLAQSLPLPEAEMSWKKRRERCRSDGRGGRGRSTWRGRAGLHEGGWRRRSAGLDDGREFLGGGSWRRKGKSFSQRVSCCCRLSNPASLPTLSLSSVCAFSHPSRPPDSLAERVLGFVQVLVSSAPYHQLLASLLTNPSLLPSFSLLTCLHGLGCKLREAGAAADKAVV